jgi:hypothetical protein
MNKQHTEWPWSLEAVKDYLRHGDTGTDAKSRHAHIVRAAIAKAEGRNP